jgi:hypothetical protein
MIEVPPETITVHEEYMLITGRAERIVELRLNGKPIPVTEEGAFEEPFLLSPGTNHLILILEARDARGRETKRTLDILFVPRESPPPTSTPTESGP